MSIDIDSIDINILYAFIKDARTKIKDIAKACNVSPTAISKRIYRLKKLGVITGAVLLVDLKKVGDLYPGSIEIESIKEEVRSLTSELRVSHSTIEIISDLKKIVVHNKK